MSFLDSGGLRALLDVERDLRERGGSLTLVTPSDEVRQVLAMTDLLEQFRVIDDQSADPPAG